MKPFGNLLRLTGTTLTLMALIATALYTPWSAEAQEDPDLPSAPTNLEVAWQSGNNADGFSVVLQWDYDTDDDGYVLDKRKTDSGEWECVVAGEYPDGSSIKVSTLKGGKLEAGDDWYFRVFSINEHGTYYIDEATCDETAQFGYVREVIPGDGPVYSFSNAAEVGPVSISDPADTEVADLATPTGFTVDSAAHGRVRLSWDLPDDNGATTGYVLTREYLGTDGVDQCVFWPLSLWTRFRDRFVAAYDTANDANKYEYRLYPINDKHDRTGCYSDPIVVPDSTPAEATATLTTSSKIGVVSSKLTYSNPPVPRNIRHHAYYSSAAGAGSKVIIGWRPVRDIPAYQVRYKDDDPMSDWTTITLESMNFPQMWGADGRDDYVAPNSYYFTPDGELTGGTTYTFQVGSCDNTDCDNVTWSAEVSIQAAGNS